MPTFATMLIGAVVFGVVAAISVYLWKNRKKGCSGNCANCGSRCNPFK